MKTMAQTLAFYVAIAAIMLVFTSSLVTANDTFHCKWLLSLGKSTTDPMNAPKGMRMYLGSTPSRDATRIVLEALNASGLVQTKDVKSIREFKALGTAFTASMTPTAVSWLCSQPHLDDHIVQLELDQRVQSM